MSEERYEIIKLLGKGRTGGVYEAEDMTLGRKVAMRRFFSQTELTDISEYEDDFLNISQSLSSLQHPNLLRVFDAGLDEDGAFIISQMMQGDTLHNRLKEGALSDWDVWDLGHQMLDALSTAHAAGFVHGAITPGSILMSPRARGGFLYVILDMGLCRLAPLIQGQNSILSMMADPAILAPELFDGSEATEKADLYMLGNILYMCLAGGHPFAGKTLEECSKLHRGGLPLLKDFAPNAPDDFVAWIAELCEVNAHDRPHSVVTALKTMPEVPKPANARATGIHITPNPATTPVALVAPASTLGSTVAGVQNPATSHPANVTGAVSAAGQAVASNAVTNTFQQPEKSKKGLFIALGSVALLIIILVVVMRSGNKKTGEEIAAEKASKNNQSSNKRNTSLQPKEKRTPVVPQDFSMEKIIDIGIYEGGPLRNNWKFLGKSHQRSAMNGWAMYDATGVNPSVVKRITSTDFEDMFNKGWTMKYRVFTQKGTHIVGLYISAQENLYWKNTDKAIGFYLRVSKEDKDIILTHEASGFKRRLEDAAKTFVDIEFKAKPRDPSGKFELYVNGQKMKDFDIEFNQNESYGKFYMDTLFVAGGSKASNNGIWVINDFSLYSGVEE